MKPLVSAEKKVKMIEMIRKRESPATFTGKFPPDLRTAGTQN